MINIKDIKRLLLFDGNTSKFFSVLFLFIIISFHVNAQKQTETNKNLLKLVCSYYLKQKPEIPDTFSSYIYSKTDAQIPKRNYLLLTIPNMLRIARHGETEMFRETYGEYIHTDKGYQLKQQHLLLTNVYKRRRIIEKAEDFIKSNIFKPTIVEDFLLSPISLNNYKYYIYHNIVIGNNLVELSFKPKVPNTQVVTGNAIVDTRTGRILEYTYSGQHDLFTFTVNVKHGDNGYHTVLPKEINAQLILGYFGNRMILNELSVFDIGVAMSDTLVNKDDRHLMSQVRPTPLTDEEMAMLNGKTNKEKLEPKYVEEMDSLITSYDSINAPSVAADSHHDSHAFRRFMWNVVGKMMLHRVRFTFGKDDKGRVSIGPLFNPLYFTYSGHRGIVYRTKLRASYTFDEDHELSTKTVIGYSFKQNQLYTRIPIKFQFNKEHNGYVQFKMESGNHVASSMLLDQLKEESKNGSKDFDKYNIHYFRDTKLNLFGHYNLHSRIGLEAGMVYYRRTALEPQKLRELGKATKSTTFAPTFQAQYSPWGRRGPLLTGDYEHAFKGIMGSDVSYDRWEFDASYELPMTCMRKFSLRGGVGFYTHKGDDEYFLDYTNFQNNYIVGGWHDDWVGEFELLDANWYNASDYYIRCNTCYESPLLLLSFIPTVGRFVEMERFYVSALAVRSYYPYVELGYAFTNHLFSMGFFTAFSQKKYEGFGIKFNIELFEDW